MVRIIYTCTSRPDFIYRLMQRACRSPVTLAYKHHHASLQSDSKWLPPVVDPVSHCFWVTHFSVGSIPDSDVILDVYAVNVHMPKYNSTPRS